MGTLTKLIEDMIHQLPLEQACTRLLKSGKIERRGEGIEKSPFTFYKSIAHA